MSIIFLGERGECSREEGLSSVNEEEEKVLECFLERCKGSEISRSVFPLFSLWNFKWAVIM